MGDERVLNKGSVESCRIRWSWLTQLAYYKGGQWGQMFHWGLALNCRFGATFRGVGMINEPMAYNI